MRVEMLPLGGGLGTIVVSWVLPMTAPSLPHWVQIALLVVGVILIVASVIAPSRKRASVMADSYNNNGNNFGHMGPVNFGRQEFQLTPAHLAELLRHIPANRSVRLRVVGNARAQVKGREVSQALQRAGHSVSYMEIGMLAPPLDTPFTVHEDDAKNFVVTFDPNA